MTETISRDFIQLLLARIDLVDLIGLQIQLNKKSNSNYFARCPFHNEKSASFSVSQPKQFYYCFGCGAHGNAIDFLMQHDQLNFPEAIEALARIAGMEVPKTASYVKKDDTLPGLYDIVAQVTEYYYNEMRQSERAVAYLKNRGITGAIAQQFQIGYASTGWSHVLDKFGTEEADKKKLLDTGLIIKKDGGGYYDRFRDRVMFPIHDYRGRIIGFGGRILDQGEPKYLNSPETPLFQKGHELYGLYHAIKANRDIERIVIVEGFIDVIALFQHGITYAVATLGTATSVHHLHRLSRYTTEIVFCFDGDEAGRTAAWRALQIVIPVMQDTMQVRFLFLPDGEDPDSLIRKEGKEVFEKRMQSAMSLSAFFFQTLSQQSDLNTMEGRAQFASACLVHIRQLPAAILQTMFLEELSKRARIDINGLKQQIKPGQSAQPATAVMAPAVNSSPAADIKLAAPIKLAIALLLQQPSLALLISEPLPTSTLPGHQFLVNLIELGKANPQITPAALIEQWRGKKEDAFVMKMLQWEHMVPEAGIQNEFLDAIRRLTILSYKLEIDLLLAKSAQNSLTDEEKVELTQLIAKKNRVEQRNLSIDPTTA